MNLLLKIIEKQPAVAFGPLGDPEENIQITKPPPLSPISVKFKSGEERRGRIIFF
jgi:hypothetical protein